jgi:2-amino-4-hydroxy-6-hydroxymethyldihydropteridine diphosphokinase
MNARHEAVAYIGLGSNLEEPSAQVRSALRALRESAQIQVEACSSFYHSAPVGLTGQPDFINAVCRARTALAPEALLQALLEIERAHGRVRGGPKGGPRTLDLDLLLYGAEIRDTPALRLPHPRLHERAFVLVPLAELDPGLVIPGHGTVTQLLGGCHGQRLERVRD